MAKGQHMRNALRFTRAAVLRTGTAGAAALASSASGLGGGRAFAQVRAPIRWDIANLEPVTGGLAVAPGGEASARADDSPPAPAPAARERITYTGNGLFVRSAPRNVSGGGTYVIRNKQGARSAAAPTASPNS